MTRIGYSLAILLLSPGFLRAQVTSGAISGTVRDGSGAVIPDVRISLKNVDTGVVRNATTNEQGRFQAPNLSLGNYEVQAEKEGFQMGVRRGIVLTVGREAVVNFDLQIGAVTQTVEVTEEAPLVETTGSSVSALVETVQIQDLPLNGRSYDELASLQPGITPSRFQTRAFQGGYTTKLSIRGARGEQNSFLLDGTDVMGPTNQIPGSVGGQSLGVDTVREFRVETGTFSAQYGRAAGGVLNVITKGGTNEFHGTVFEFIRNDNLDANRWAANRALLEKPEFKRNQFGFSAGGPIKKDKLFYFGSYEGLRDRLGQTLSATVPTPAARQRAVAAVAPYINLYPLPNGPEFTGGNTAQYTEAYSQPTDEDFLTIRTDYSLSSSDSFFARYTFDDGARQQAASFSFLQENQGSRNQYLTLEESHIFTPSLLNTARFGINRTFSSLIPETPGIADSLKEQLAFIPGIPFLAFGNGITPGSGVSAMTVNANIPRIWAWNLFEWSDDLTFTTGSHTFKGGVLFKRMQFNQIETLNAGGQYTFAGLEQFLNGRPQSVRVLQPGAGLSAGWRYNYFGWYIQDDYRISSRLTLNLGFRHEFYTMPTEKYDRVCNLDSIYGLGGTPDAPNATFRCGGSLWPDYYKGMKNFGPKIGFAWDIAGNGMTSVRGGFGIFYDAMAPLWWVAPADTQPPASLLLTPSNSAACQAGTQTTGCLPFPNLLNFLVTGTGAAQPGPSPAGFTGTPSSLQYTLTIQRQLGRDMVASIGYVGSVARHLWTRAQKNIVEPTILSDGRKCFNYAASQGGPNPSCPNGPLTRRNPTLSSRVLYNLSEANSTYNGLILSLQKRMSHGLQFQVSHTFSRALDTGSSISFGVTANANATNGLLDPDNWKLDQSLSDLDVRHNFAFNSIWDLPVGPGKAWGSNLGGPASALLGGWQVSGLLKIASSTPFTVGAASQNWSRNGSATPSERPNLAPGASNNPVSGTSAGCTLTTFSSTAAVTGSQTVAGGQKLGTPDLWFDPCAFRPPTFGFYGNLGRNTVSGPNLVSVDFSAIKNFDLKKISEQFRIQFRAELFNIFNHPSFGVPEFNIFDSAGRIIGNAGRISDTSTSPRDIQFGLKLFW